MEKKSKEVVGSILQWLKKMLKEMLFGLPVLHGLLLNHNLSKMR